MKSLLILALTLAVVVSGSALMAADQERTRSCDQACDPAGDQLQDRDRDCTCDGFVDEDGDGVCDNCDGTCNPDAPDQDGDGIPNGQDDDYVPPQDGSGYRGGR